MDIIVNFGSRKYVFHSQQDVHKATEIYAHCIGDLKRFANELDDHDIDFEYSFTFEDKT